MRLELWYWPGSLMEGTTAGVWSALARDFADGQLYRPLLSEAGYGGTRYMPLFFLLHGGLARWTGQLFASGIFLQQATVLLMVVALYRLLRRQELEREVSLALVSLVFGTVLFQRVSLQLRSDFLAAGAVFLVVLCLENFLERGRRFWLAAALFWTLTAFFSKFTSIYVLAYVVWRLARQGYPSLAAFFVFCVAAFGGAGVALVEQLSHGNFLANLSSTALGGLDGSALVRGALVLGRCLTVTDPLTFSLCLLPLAIARKDRSNPPQALLLLIAGVTFGIFMSPGTWINHFADLVGASILVLGSMFAAGGRAKKLAGATCALFFLLQLITCLPGCPSVHRTLLENGVPTWAQAEDIHRRYLPRGTVYFSEIPTLALEADERPWLLDEFNLKLFLRRSDPVGLDFAARVRAGFFQVGVLSCGDWQSGDEDEFWRTRAPEYAFLRQYYSLVAVLRPYAILAFRDAKGGPGRDSRP